MKVTVNKNVCIGNGMCIGIVSEAFKFGEDGKSQAYNTDPELADLIREAEENCPVGAIIIEEDD
ncbi:MULTISPECIES: ferredoxin [Neobacillus]|uniref:Ferredoxin n=1 Tax=Neobacillus rhizophilus TaxID=2833579 RepID=A0A942YWJ1_9BACI|nr:MULTISPECIES: ferredoxin [Neobacillus]MBS4215129.1 ferredoxin [Neobacillus rhizophilus]